MVGKHVFSVISMSGKETLSSNILIQIRALNGIFKDIGDMNSLTSLCLLPVYNTTLDNAF